VIKLYKEDNKIKANVSDLRNWEHNPRYIKEEDFEQLVLDLENEEIKPMIVLDDGTVLGGNMRLRAYRKLGKEKAWVTVISLRNDGELVTAFVNGIENKTKFQSEEDAMLHYSTVDNSAYGANDPDKLAELFYKSALPIENYLVTMGEPQPISDLVKDVSEELEEETKEKKIKKLSCPSCGHEWEE